MSISLGLAENYAMLGSRYLYLEDVVDVNGFIGSNFLSYPADPNLPLDSNGIQLIAGSIPNAPIVNGAAAKQAIDDVKTAIPLYQAVTPQYVGTNILNTSYNNPGCYNISGNLTTSADVTLTGSATDIYVFNVTGKITITNNIDPGNILPQNVIFIASNTVAIGTIGTIDVSGIYISTGSHASIQNATLTGRLISTYTTINGYAVNYNSSITAPQFA